MKLTKKNKIVLITLAVVLVALLIVYFVAVAPLLDGEGVVYPIPQDGEGLNRTTLMLYPEIDQEDLVSIHVKNKDGEYTFKQVFDDKGKASIVIDGYEKLEYDTGVLSYLTLYALTPVIADNQPYRNLTDEQMAEYGVTEDTCQASMTVTYKDGDQVKTKVIRIGHRAFTASETYYVALEGRNTAYRFTGLVRPSILSKLEDYIIPLISNIYPSASEAVIDMNRFSILKGTSDNLKPYILLTGETFYNSEDVASVEYTYHILNDQGKIVKSTPADLSYAMYSISLFYTQLVGDKVVCIDPDTAKLDEYGLGENDIIYAVTGSYKDGDLVPMFFSQAFYDEDIKQNVYYTLVDKDGVGVIMRVPESSLIPKTQTRDEESVVFNEDKNINWVATNSLGAGFDQAIQGDHKWAGVDNLTIKVPTSVYSHGKETFFIDYITNQKNESILQVTSASGRYEDKGPEKIKTFNHFFAVLITYPSGVRLNNMSEDEIAAAMTDANFMYSIEAEMNDGTMQKYEYYSISTEYVMVCVTEGEKDSGGQITWNKTRCVFDTSRGQILDAIYVAFNQLMSGEEIDVK